jgi:hypothetical protein
MAAHWQDHGWWLDTGGPVEAQAPMSTASIATQFKKGMVKVNGRKAGTRTG